MLQKHTCLYGGEEAGRVLHQVCEDEFEPQVVELCQDVKSLGATCSMETAAVGCAAKDAGFRQIVPRLEWSSVLCSWSSWGTRRCSCGS